MSAGRAVVLVLAITGGALLLLGVFAQPWWQARWGDGSMEVSTGGNRVCIAGECRFDSLEELEERLASTLSSRKTVANEHDRLDRERISRSTWLRIVALVTTALTFLAAVVGLRRRGRVGLPVGIALLFSATAAAVLAVEVFKATEYAGDVPHVEPGAGFFLAFAGAILAGVAGAWVAAPVVAMLRGAASIVAALAVAGAVLLAAGAFSTWSWSTQTSPRGEVRSIRSTTLLRATECFGGEPCPVVWLGEHRSEDPPAAVWAGRITFATSIVTSAAGAVLVASLLRRRSRRSRSVIIGRVAIAVVLGGALVVLGSAAWFLTQVPKLSPVLTFLGWGPLLAVSGAVFIGAAAVWSRGLIASPTLPEAIARSGA